MAFSVPAIRTSGLTKYYDTIPGIIDLDLNVERGEIFGFLGPNGSGKTTTIRLLMDFLRPTRGRAEIFGLDVKQHARELRQMVGNLPGEFTVYPQITGERFLEICRSGHIKYCDRSEEIALRLDLDLNRRISSLSHGNKQKLGIVQAMMADPELIILDEPTNGLDPLVRQELFVILKEQKARGKTVFFSSHNLTEVERICDRVGIVRNGRLVGVECIAEILAHKVRKMHVTFSRETDPSSLTSESVKIVSFTDTDAILSVKGGLRDLLTRLSGLPVDDIVFPEASLEDTFMSFYQAEHEQ